MSVCPSVCLSVRSNTIYSLISCLIWPVKIFMESSHQGQCFKTFLNNIGLLMKKFSYAVHFLKIMFVQALCLDAVTICPHFVRMLTTLSFFIWYVEKIYLWNPYVITKVIKLFWFDSVEAESIFWQPKNFISQFVLSVCLSVCLLLRLFEHFLLSHFLLDLASKDISGKLLSRRMF